MVGIARLDLGQASKHRYILGRKIVFLGRVLAHGVISKTWHYRLFRTGLGRCEDRLYDQLLVSSGASLQAFWFRVLVDAKIYKARLSRQGTNEQ